MERKLWMLVVCFAFSLMGAQITEQKMDELIQKTLKTFDVPGISVGVIKDGQVVYAKGMGVKSLNSQLPMKKETLVGIASNSKAFTCVALGMLVDEGKLSWDDKVSKHIPEFQMYDPYVSQEITIRDLVTHRAGLGLGQGDLMFFPEGGSLSIKDIVYNVRYLKPKNAFRTTLDYNNIMFIVAGEVISRISGLSWAEFIEQRIMKPVGMTASYGSYNRAAKADKISAHAPVDGKIVEIPHDWNETANAAGGIMSNIPDMLTWANFVMNGFTTKDGKKLLSDKQARELWTLQISSPVGANNPYDSKFYGYGLGWFLTDVRGKLQVQHSGGLIGTVTHFTLIPELKLGIVVLTNQQSGAAFTAITNTVKDAYIGGEARDWVTYYGERQKKADAYYHKQKTEAYAKAAAFAKDKNAQLKDEQFVGSYKDVWFGEVKVLRENGKLRLVCQTSPRLKGDLSPYSKNSFIIKWDDRSYDADAYFILNFDEKEKATSARLKPISDITDFSFDFEDLDLQRL